jgi:hypothetical protein
MALAEIAAAESGVLGPLPRQNGAAVDQTAPHRRGRPTGDDPVDLSPLGRRLADLGFSASEDKSAMDQGMTGEAAAGGMIRNALQTMRGDLASVLRAFGFDGTAIDEFARSFVEPVIEALNSNANFHAELSFSTISEVTRVTSSSFNQETSLSARSLEIDVNHTTGEVAVTFASLNVEQKIFVAQSSREVPLPAIGSGFGGPPPVDGSEDKRDDPIARLLDEARERLAELAEGVQSSISLDGLEQYVDEAGDTHSKFYLQASTPLDPAPRQDAREPLDIIA